MTVVDSGSEDWGKMRGKLLRENDILRRTKPPGHCDSAGGKMKVIL